MEEVKLKITKYIRYMDDGRAVLYPIKAGWRWEEGNLWYCKRWEIEDSPLSGVEVTRRVIEASMQEVLPFLKFTTEVGEGEEGWLPTLDTQVRVEGNNMISFKYYEKPTVTNVMVQKRSAMGENSKVQILANEMMRRLGNTDQRQGKHANKEVVDGFEAPCAPSWWPGHSQLPSKTCKVLQECPHTPGCRGCKDQKMGGGGGTQLKVRVQ